MPVFHSMTNLLLYTFATVAVLLWFGTGRQPFAAAGLFARALLTSPRNLVFFLSMLGILLLNKYELKLEAFFPIHYDLTSAITGWEGGWQARLQSFFHSDMLTLFCSFFYLVVFQAVMIASVGIYISARNFKMYYAFCVALLLNYFIAVPFFLFVPVNEAWAASPSVHFLMLDAFPRFETEYRQLSGLNNCFPSLHTSISVTMALLAARSGNRRWAIFAAANAAIILFSIFYLGIHWFSDMAAGLCLACLCAAIGLKVGAWADGRQPATERAKNRRKWAPSPSRSPGS